MPDFIFLIVSWSIDKPILLLYYSKQGQKTMIQQSKHPTFRAVSFQPPSTPVQENNKILDPWLRATRINPTFAYEWRCEKTWEQEPRCVSEAMWYWIKKGTGRCWLGEKSKQYKLRSGDLLLIPQDIPNAVWPDKGVAFKLSTVHFFAHVYGTIDLLSVLGIGGVYPTTTETPFETATRTLTREYGLKSPGWNMAMTSAIVSVLLHIIRHHSSPLKLPLGIHNMELIKLQPVLELIDNHLDDTQLMVADLADAIDVSEVYLRIMFKRAGLVSPVQFIRRRRIDRACMLLSTTELPIKNIAERCGFRDIPFFYRVFKRLSGTTPLKHRIIKKI